MAADLTTVTERVTEILNACSAGTFSATIDSNYKDRNATAISEAVREAALMIGAAICANPNHVHRNVFVSGTPTALTNDGEMPDMSGESDLIEIQPYSAASYITGIPRTAQQIDDYRTNYNSAYGSLSHTTQGSPLTGFYAITNGRIKFTGNAAQGYFPLLSRSTITTLIPDEYEPAWVKLSVGLCIKEGDNLMPEATTYYNWGLQDLAAISAMGTVPPVPPIPARQERTEF